MRKPRTKSPAKGLDADAKPAAHTLPSAGDLDTRIAEVRSWHRQRCFALDQRMRIDNALLAFLRTQLGWSMKLSDKERKAVASQAAKLLAIGERVFKGKATAVADPAFGAWSGVIIAAISSRKVWDDIEAASVKEMARLAVELPVWSSFGESIRGFGAPSLAVIVGEAGDLANYSNPAKLWKRMGLAVMDGVRQGGLPKGAGAEAWIAHGYSPRRRSRMFMIGDTLMKGNRDGIYRTLYLDRKKHELARDPDMRPIQAHRRAQRYMEKRLLKNLWQAWRRAIRCEQTIHCLPAAEIRQTNELLQSAYAVSASRSATSKMPTGACLPSAPIKKLKAKAKRRVGLVG